MNISANTLIFWLYPKLKKQRNSLHPVLYYFHFSIYFFDIKIFWNDVIAFNIFSSNKKDRYFQGLPKHSRKGFCVFAHVNLKCICWRVFQPFLVNHQSVFLRRRCANKMIDILRNSPKICFACLLLAKWSRRNFWYLCTRRSFITSAYNICII